MGPQAVLEGKPRLTSTCLAMLLACALLSTEHPELNRCTSRLRGLWPATMLLAPNPQLNTRTLSSAEKEPVIIS